MQNSQTCTLISGRTEKAHVSMFHHFLNELLVRQYFTAVPLKGKVHPSQLDSLLKQIYRLHISHLALKSPRCELRLEPVPIM